jgi:hypothetical protein
MKKMILMLTWQGREGVEKSKKERKKKETEKKERKKKKEKKKEEEKKKSKGQSQNWALTVTKLGPNQLITIHRPNFASPNDLGFTVHYSQAQSDLGFPKIQSPTEMGTRHIQRRLRLRSTVTSS